MNARSKTHQKALAHIGWIVGTFAFTLSAFAAAPVGKSTIGTQPPDAAAILARMAEFLSKAPHMSVTVQSSYDTVQPKGLKVEWDDVRKVTLKRPDFLRINTERSDGARTILVFDGKNIIAFDQSANVYARAPQPGDVDQTVIHFVRDMRMRIPLAVLLLSRLPEELQNRVQTVAYVEKTTTLGQSADHLVGQTGTVDFQLWIPDGDQPLPLRAVLTYRNAPGEPEFRAQFSDWDIATDPANSMFAFTPPTEAKQIPFASALQQVASRSKRRAMKGAKK